MYKQRMLTPGYAGSLTWRIAGTGEITGSINFTTGADHLLLKYRYRRVGDDWQDIEERVPIERTDCHLGGTRPWLKCPLCHKRVAVLYGVDARFLCRHCYALPYGSQQEGRLDRLTRKQRKIREKLGADGDCIIREKPKHMHWRTFERLSQKEQDLDICREAMVSQKLARWDHLL